ncbi:MAG TPA: ABC transporter substrate-binding protein [Conexibacter sp.]|nr:ABC transporter substrate-binding protein [Conexibacter sp.]
MRFPRTPRRRRGFPLAVCAALCIALAAAGCGGGGGTKTAALVKIGTSSTIDTVNPFTALQLLPNQLFDQEYPFLFYHDHTGHLKGDFATDWTISNQFKTIRITVHSGGKWSDGQPLTAKDAAWMLNTVVRLKAGPGANFDGYMPTLKSASAPNDTTLVVQLSAPTTVALGQLASIPILPEHVWAKYAKGDGKALTTFQNPAPHVGGGPFYLAKYTPKQIAIFNVNPGYYGPKPHVKRLGFTLYSSTDAMVQGIKNGEVDAINGAPYASLPALRKAGVHIDNPDAFDSLWLTINDSSKPTQHPELHNLKVREAIDMAVDRERIVRTAMFGSAEPGAAVMPPANLNLHLDAPPTPFDLDQANTILDGLGYKKGSDGIRVANGHKMSYKVILLQDPGGPEQTTLEIMKNDLRQIGIQINVTPLDATAALAALEGPKKDYSTFDMFMLSFIGNYLPSGTLPVFRCNALGAYNYSGTCSKEFDALDDKATAATDEATAQKYTLDEQRWVMEHRPLLVIAYLKDIYAYRDPWTGFVAGPQGWFYGTHETAVSVAQK